MLHSSLDHYLSRPKGIGPDYGFCFHWTPLTHTIRFGVTNSNIRLCLKIRVEAHTFVITKWLDLGRLFSSAYCDGQWYISSGTFDTHHPTLVQKNYETKGKNIGVWFRGLESAASWAKQRRFRAQAPQPPSLELRAWTYFMILCLLRSISGRLCWNVFSYPMVKIHMNTLLTQCVKRL